MAEPSPISHRKRRLAPVFAAAAPWALAAAVAAAWLAGQPRRLPPPPPPGPLPEPPRLPGLSEPVPPDPAEIDRLEPGHGRLARGPWEIPPLGWRDIVWRTYREISEDRLQAVAASLTFYVLLAIFPGLGVFVSLYGLIADVQAVQGQLQQLALVLPPDAVRLLGDQMLRLATERSANLSAAFLVSLLISIWSANAGMKSLFDGLNIAYDEEEKRNWFLRSGLTYAFTLAFLVFLTLMTAILVAAPIALQAAGVRDDWLIGLRWGVLFLLATGGLAFAFRHGPSRRRARLRWLVPGAAAAALLWMGGSVGFSWYLNNVAHLQVTYGSLGAVVGFLLWVYFSALIVLMGAEFSAEVEHQTAVDTTMGAARPMGARGAVMADTVGRPFIGLRKGVGLLWGVGRRIAGRVRRTRLPAPPAAPPGPRRSAG